MDVGGRNKNKDIWRTLSLSRKISQNPALYKKTYIMDYYGSFSGFFDSILDGNSEIGALLGYYLI